MSTSGITTIVGALVGICAIAAATVGVVTGHVSGEAFTAIVTGVGGVGIGAGTHASGVSSAPAVTATTGPPPIVSTTPQ